MKDNEAIAIDNHVMKHHNMSDKIILRKTLETNYCSELDCLTLCDAAEHIRKTLEHYQSKGYDNIRFNCDYEYDYSGESIRILNIIGNRLETDEEYANRIECDQKDIALKRQKDIALLEKLANDLGVKIEKV